MEKWKDLDIKNRIAVVTAIAAFIVGWGLTIAGFIVPPLGAVSESVLWILGQALLYAASVFGVALYVGGEVKRLKGEVRSYMRNPQAAADQEKDEE